MKLTGGQTIIKYLESEGVPYALGIPGHGILGFFDALRESVNAGKMKYIQVMHEQSAVHIADGYFRIKGEPLCVFTSIGPGTLNTAIGLATAYVDSSAVFQVSGDTHVHMKGVGVLQEIERYQDSNIVRSLEPLAKRAWRVESAAQLPRLMQRSFNQMLTGRRGPVVLTLPMDIQADEIDAELPVPGLHRAAGKPAGDAALIVQAVRVMSGAKRPVILSGGATLTGNLQDKLIRLAELWGAAVVTNMASKSVFPEDHPLNAFHTGSKGTPVGLKYTSGADVVLALGTRFADENTCSYKEGVGFSFKKAKLIHVDIDPAEIGKNYPASVGIIGDAGTVIDQLIAQYEQDVTDKPSYMESAYVNELISDKEEWFAAIEKKRSVVRDEITISQLIGELQESVPDNVIISSSSGNTQAQLFQEFIFKKGQRHLTTGGFSTMGWAMPAAIGAKLAEPSRPVLALLGDGDFMMTMQELSVLARYEIPVVVLVANNSGWMAIKDLQEGMLGHDYVFGNDFLHRGEPYTPDFAKAAASFGVDSLRISQPGEVKEAVKQAFGLNKPVLIHVDVCREYPDSGGDAYGWWDVPIPAYIEDRRKKYLDEKRGETV